MELDVTITMGLRSSGFGFEGEQLSSAPWFAQSRVCPRVAWMAQIRQRGIGHHFEGQTTSRGVVDCHGIKNSVRTTLTSRVTGVT